MPGYKDPPLHTRFQKGAPSPNPNGRPKKRTIVADFEEELQQQIAEEGNRSLTTKQRLLVKKRVDAAIAGDTRAIATVLNMCPRRSNDTVPESNDEDDREVLDVFSHRGSRNDQPPSE